MKMTFASANFFLGLPLIFLVIQKFNIHVEDIRTSKLLAEVYKIVAHKEKWWLE